MKSFTWSYWNSFSVLKNDQKQEQCENEKWHIHRISPKRRQENLDHNFVESLSPLTRHIFSLGAFDSIMSNNNRVDIILQFDSVMSCCNLKSLITAYNEIDQDIFYDCELNHKIDKNSFDSRKPIDSFESDSELLSPLTSVPLYHTTQHSVVIDSVISQSNLQNNSVYVDSNTPRYAELCANYKRVCQELSALKTLILLNAQTPLLKNRSPCLVSTDQTDVEAVNSSDNMIDEIEQKAKSDRNVDDINWTVTSTRDMNIVSEVHLQQEQQCMHDEYVYRHSYDNTSSPFNSPPRITVAIDKILSTPLSPWRALTWSEIDRVMHCQQQDDAIDNSDCDTSVSSMLENNLNDVFGSSPASSDGTAIEAYPDTVNTPRRENDTNSYSSPQRKVNDSFTSRTKNVMSVEDEVKALRQIQQKLDLRLHQIQLISDIETHQGTAEQQSTKSTFSLQLDGFDELLRLKDAAIEALQSQLLRTQEDCVALQCRLSTLLQEMSESTELKLLLQSKDTQISSLTAEIERLRCAV